MKQALALILASALIAGTGAAWAQQAPVTPPAQQPQVGPGMMCPCMTMRMQQLTPEQQKQMQGCPMWQTMRQQQPAQPQPKK